VVLVFALFLKSLRNCNSLGVEGVWDCEMVNTLIKDILNIVYRYLHRHYTKQLRIEYNVITENSWDNKYHRFLMKGNSVVGIQANYRCLSKFSHTWSHGNIYSLGVCGSYFKDICVLPTNY
jgi:hypothetical protein